jgi:hypothetical protein
MNGLSAIIGHGIEWGIRGWVACLGRRLPLAEPEWLNGPVGTPGRIGPDFYEGYVREAGLEARVNAPDTGLLPDFGALAGPAFDPARVHPRVREFYERTVDFKLEAWSQWSPLAYPFACVLMETVSRRIEQLNLPVGPLETSRGMTSDVIQLVDPATGTPRHALWLRRIVATGDVVYAGFYGVATPPLASGPCVKVVFPLPHGSATVILWPEARADGSLVLHSAGKGFGDAGFYRVLQTGKSVRRVRLIRAMKETIHVYVDPEGTLRTDHTFRFFRYTMLRLHYKITPKEGVGAA